MLLPCPVIPFLLPLLDDLYHAHLHFVDLVLLFAHPILDFVHPVVHIIELVDLQVAVFALLFLSHGKLLGQILLLLFLLRLDLLFLLRLFEVFASGLSCPLLFDHPLNSILNSDPLTRRLRLVPGLHDGVLQAHSQLIHAQLLFVLVVIVDREDIV